MICRHCQRNKANRPRGLCWSCYYRPGIRDQYPSTSKYAPTGEPAQAQLDAMIAEQQKTMPKK